MRPSTATARADLQEFLDCHLAALNHPQVMDAGCGGAMRVKLPAGAVLNGIDISPESAARNSTLFNIVIGDVQSYPLPRAAFDIVICWELLEHVPHPLAALANLVAATKPGGFIILAFPNRTSLKGLVTRLSPHSCMSGCYAVSGARRMPAGPAMRRSPLTWRGTSLPIC